MHTTFSLHPPTHCYRLTASHLSSPRSVIILTIRTRCVPSSACTTSLLTCLLDEGAASSAESSRSNSAGSSEEPMMNGREDGGMVCGGDEWTSREKGQHGLCRQAWDGQEDDLRARSQTRPSVTRSRRAFCAVRAPTWAGDGS